MVVARAGDQQVVLGGHPHEAGPGVVGVVPVGDLEPGEPGVDHGLEDLGPHHPAAGRREGVGEHGHPPGGAHEVHGVHGVGGVVGDVVAGAGVQHRGEGGGAVLHDPGADQGVGDVRAAHRRVLADVVQHHVPVDRVVLREQLDHALGPGAPGQAAGLDLRQQGRLRGVVQVAQQVHRDAVAGGAGDLHARHEGDAQGHGRVPGGLPPGRGVVVGEGEHVQPGRVRGTGDVRGALGAVRVGRVGVQVDLHRRMVARKSGPSGPTGAHDSGRCWFSTYCATTDSGASPAEAAK